MNLRCFVLYVTRASGTRLGEYCMEQAGRVLEARVTCAEVELLVSSSGVLVACMCAHYCLNRRYFLKLIRYSF